MERDVALRIERRLIGIRASLDGLARYVKANCSDGESKRIVRFIGSSMAETIDISTSFRAS
ncbi:MAG TPA: hypothetical protein VFE34_12045 [Dongiaceae bacterium]|jgi:hypothetical protein|nr:hypothetical protein [Dongiaceae bacterium]